MSTLDCENITTLYNSLEEITGVKKTDFDTFLYSFDINDFYFKNPHFLYPQDVFLFVLKNKFRAKINHDNTCWFHATRAKQNQDFHQGLLPLNKTIDSIWNDLYILLQDKITENQWIIFRKSLENNYNNHHASLYRGKINDSCHWGPYGFLAKDLICFDNNFSAWHYFGGSEIVIDICECTKEYFNINLEKLYQNSTSPCVVKFKHEVVDKTYLGFAIFYLYMIIKNESLSYDENVCFTPRGNVIEKDNIVDIQFIDK